ncbi:MAG TPA: endo-1,4-beta-xylanase [Anaerolineales bacterium]|nr:endo-1,4-beta-xylanase [Anaerolineales bacterium]
MSKKLGSMLFLIVLLFSACSPAATVAPTSTAVPPTATATALPTANLTQAASLFSGPGNADFDSLAALPAGTAVTPLATYADFVQVSASVDGQEAVGYVWKNTLASLPSGLPDLAADQVPWAPLYLPECSPGTFDAAHDIVTFANPGDGYSDTESSAISLTEPLRISVGGMTSDPGNAAPAIKVLGIPEPASGDWWSGITRLDFGSRNGEYFLGIRDGSMADDGFYLDLSVKSDQAIQVWFDQPEGKSLRILDGNGSPIQSIDLTATPGLHLPNGLFPNGVVYIGTTMPPKSTFTISQLRIGVEASGKWDDLQNGYYSEPGLAALAAPRHITIGTEFQINSTSDPRYCRTMRRDFDLAVLSEFSWPGMWLGPGQYDFSALDRAVDYASRRGWRIRASHLLWGAPDAIPDWLKNGRYTRDQYIQLMQQYIRDVVGRYKGRVQEWSIANEATNRSFYPGGDFWGEKIGPEYIAIAFRTAREADPNGVLIFNDDNNQAPQDPNSARVVDKMYATVKQLKADGVPIDVVGMQMHLFLPWNSPFQPKKADVIATMQKFAGLGVRIYVTEFDVDLARQKGDQAEKWSLEATIYGDMMEACLESGVCDSFSTWEFSDALSWITCDTSGCVQDKNADPLPFDANYVPKPAYFAVRDALLNDFTLVPMPTPTK